MTLCSSARRLFVSRITESGQVDSFLELLSSQGWPTALLFGAAYLVHRIAVWLGPRLDKLIDGHVDLMTTLGDALKVIVSQVNEIHSHLIRRTQNGGEVESRENGNSIDNGRRG